MSYGLLSPKVDFVFKKIFGNENKPEILISFLNAVIKPKNLITKVVIKNSDIDKEHIEDKYSRLDIKATTSNNEEVNIEIQVKNEYNMIERSLYYWSKMYEGQLSEGDSYDKLTRTVCINILDFKYLKTDKFHTGYRLKEIETNEELTELEEIHFIELPKLKEKNDDEEIVDVLEAWIKFINNPIDKDIEKLEMNVHEIKEAKAELIRLSGDKKEVERYEQRKFAKLDEISAIRNAEKRGIEEGLIKVAKNALKNKIDIEIIIKMTGLTKEEIEKLK